MSKYIEVSDFEPTVESFTPSQESPLAPSPEVPSEVATPSCELATNSHPPLWRPTKPQFTKAIADYYGVSRKSVQEWFRKVATACPWFAESDLKLSDGRYTTLCIELMGDYRTAGLPFEAWKTRIWEQNCQLASAYEQAQAQQQPTTHQEETWQRGGQLATQQTSHQVQPIIQFNINSLNVTLPSADTSQLDAETQHLQSVTAQGAGILKDFIKAQFKSELAQVIAQNRNLATGIQTASIMETVEELGVGKSSAPAESQQSS